MTMTKKNIIYSDVVRHFQCLGAECEDTCCQGWGMQVDQNRKELYANNAPELLEAVVAGEAELVMKRNVLTGFCVKFEDGLCGIHKQYGTDFLGDACHFFPRIVRKFGNTITVSAALSCPEIARIALLEKQNPVATAPSLERLPHSLKDYLPEGVSSEDCFSVMENFLQLCSDADLTSGDIIARIFTVSKSLKNISITNWKDASKFLIKTADARLHAPRYNAIAPYQLFHALVTIVSAAKPYQRPRLMALMQTMEKALDVEVNWENQLITGSNNRLSAYNSLIQQMDNTAHMQMEHIMRQWLAMQLSMASYPFSGFGKTLEDKALLLSFRFTIVRLALLCHTVRGAFPDDDTVIYVVQTLSRFLDHLADPTLSLTLCHELGWVQEANLMGLLMQPYTLRAKNHDKIKKCTAE